MRALLIIASLTLGAVPLSGCVADMAQRDGGVATYDAIRAAQQDCAAKGRVFRLKRNGQAKYLDDYACEKE